MLLNVLFAYCRLGDNSVCYGVGKSKTDLIANKLKNNFFFNFCIAKWQAVCYYISVKFDKTFYQTF